MESRRTGLNDQEVAVILNQLPLQYRTAEIKILPHQRLGFLYLSQGTLPTIRVVISEGTTPRITAPSSPMRSVRNEKNGV